MIAWDILQESYASNRIPSGIILNGITHNEALGLADKFAQLLLCQNSQNNNACGKCKSCGYIEQKSHPELCYIAKEDNSEVIKIDQIRSLIAKLQQTPLYGKHKVMIIVSAESMHEIAMNSLLKTLEQPPGNATIILVTTRANSIPATIKSRCSYLNIADSNVAMKELIEQNTHVAKNELYLADFLATSNKEQISELIASDFALYKAIVSCFLLQNIELAVAFGKNENIATIVAYSHKIVILCIKIQQGCEPQFMREGFSCENIYNAANYNDILSWYKLYDYHVLLQEQVLSPVALNSKTILLELYSNWQTIKRGVYVS
jgi:hypothetical protein